MMRVSLKRSGESAEFLQSLSKCILNPGCLYFHTPGFLRSLSLKPRNIAGRARVLVFNRRAKALRGMEPDSDRRIAVGTVQQGQALCVHALSAGRDHRLLRMAEDHERGVH
mgnify:CR=1 FL=1